MDGPGKTETGEKPISHTGENIIVRGRRARYNALDCRYPAIPAFQSLDEPLVSSGNTTTPPYLDSVAASRAHGFHYTLKALNIIPLDVEERTKKNGCSRIGKRRSIMNSKLFDI